ncbi:MAG: nucleotidyltransferase domain-containing protein [Thermanaerothrix sp.]|nr:nucleotidyltransferase domain-containing protein [Thermanaerothrix sp.]
MTRLHQIIARLRAERPEVLDVHLFGSLARGDATAFSDVDLLTLTRADDETDPIQRILRYLLSEPAQNC